VIVLEKETVRLNFYPLSVKVSVAAKMLGTSERVVRNLIKAKQIKAMKMPSLTISVKEMERFVQYATDNQLDFRDYGSDTFSVDEIEKKVVKFERNSSTN
jgi:hypothetical protein